jgi:hypothetical protein
MIANAHVRRVTLNIIRKAACCPTDLRPVLDKLANGIDWDIGALSKAEIEAIYAHVDEDLGEQAKEEFQADTSTIIDHRDGDADCKLCGHRHIRWEFLLRNYAGGTDHWTGSTCIETYGINVDGETTAEAALAKLRSAIGEAKRKAEREDWQKAHPNHEDDMARVDAIYAVVRRRLRWEEYKWVRPNWKNRSREQEILCKAILKYYRKHKYLTDKRTEQLYGPEGVLTVGTGMCNEIKKGRAEYERKRNYWDDLINKAYRKNLDYDLRSPLYTAKSKLIDPTDPDDWKRHYAPDKLKQVVKLLTAKGTEADND